MSGRPWTTGDALRVIRAVGTDAAGMDPDQLRNLRRIRDELDVVTAAAVASYRQAGFSDSQIGAELGVTKQAVQKRWPRQQ